MELRYLIIKVKDLERAKKFYSLFLNMEPNKTEKNRIVVFNLNNIKIGLYNHLADGHKPTDLIIGNNYCISFGVKDIKKEIERISSFAEIVSKKKKGNHEWFEFKDSEENILEIHKF